MIHASALSLPPWAEAGDAERDVGTPPEPVAGTAGSDDRTAGTGAADAPEIDIVRFRQGDPDACQLMLQRFGPLIMRVVTAYRLDPDDRDDLYQEICIRVWGRRGQFSGRGSLSGWINAIAHNECRTWLAKHGRQKSRQTEFTPAVIASDEVAGLVADPSRLAALGEFMDHLRLKLAALPRRQAQAFILVRGLGFSAKEAADILGRAPATVRSNVRHAIKKLRRSMGVHRNGLS